MAATIDENGREVLDQTPVSIPIPFTRPEPIHLRLRRIVEQYHQEMKDAAEYESFEDADDFDVGDGAPSYEDRPSEYEQDFMPHAERIKQMFPEQVTAKTEQAVPAPSPAEPPQAAPKA
jgi:hypothetical protein